eukprot:1086656-Ditylum_brightwellii.AAC.1
MPSPWKWPQQPSPNNTTWKLWRKALQSTICFENGRLHQRIGQWTAPRYWLTQYHHPTETAYIHNGTTWK